MEQPCLIRQNLHNLLKFQGLYASGKLVSARKTLKNATKCYLEAEIQCKATPWGLNSALEIAEVLAAQLLPEIIETDLLLQHLFTPRDPLRDVSGQKI
jgi:hypothetical protein